MGSDFAVGGRFPAAFMSAGTSSFTDFLSGYAPSMLPGHGTSGLPASGPLADLPHGTTIVAAACEGGVVMAGDRRATAGNMIAQRDIEKVFRSDEFSCVGIAGVAGVAHRARPAVPGRAGALREAGGPRAVPGGQGQPAGHHGQGQPRRAAMQGLVVVPLFAGYDEDSGTGRIFSYDVDRRPVRGDRFHSIGSGSVFARGSLKKLYREGLPAQDAVVVCMQALYDAADDDSATGGPDLTRGIYPIVATVTADGFRRLPDAEAGQVAQAVVHERLQAPDGPTAPLRHRAAPASRVPAPVLRHEQRN